MKEIYYSVCSPLVTKPREADIITLRIPKEGVSGVCDVPLIIKCLKARLDGFDQTNKNDPFVEIAFTAIQLSDKERGLGLHTTNGNPAPVAPQPSTQICPDCGGLGFYPMGLNYKPEQKPCERCNMTGKLRVA